MKDVMKTLSEEKLWNGYYTSVWRNITDNISDIVKTYTTWIIYDDVVTNVHLNVKINVKSNLKNPSKTQLESSYNILESL